VVTVDRYETDESTSVSEVDGSGLVRSTTLLRVLATIFGLVGSALAISVPFLPVTQQMTSLDWPTSQGTRAVSAPLTAQSPQALESRVGCRTARDLDARTNGPGTLFNTNAPNSDYGKLTGMSLQVNNGLLTLTSRGQQLGTLPLGGVDCTIVVHSDASATVAEVGGSTLASLPGDHRPQMTGIFSDLRAGEDDTTGLSVSAKVDNRWDSDATAVKWMVIVLAAGCFGGAIWTLHRLDRLTGRKAPRLAPKGWWKLKFRDVVVLGVLLVWWLIGAMTADDGYFLTMARVRGDAGYIGEYYRWMATADAPMAWFVDIYAAMTKVSTVIPWMRLPSLLMAIVCWFLISREVMPRLGQQVRRSNAAGWAAGAVFLAFWMPYDNGLRPENLVAMLSLVSLCAVERSVATRRLTPAALGLTVAALSVAANPHGLMAVLPFVAALKPLLKTVRQHTRQFGWLPVLAPIAISGFVVLALIFYDQTFAGAWDATKLRDDIGPSASWYNEFSRYVMLFGQTSDGSISRRFPVLLVFLCLATCAVVLLRRGNIRGAALGPSRRLLGMSALSFVVLALTPTKHSHHFGMLAAVGGALAALTALATSTSVLYSRRNRAAFFAGLMFITALAATGTNGWWYVSGWGVPWVDIQPQFKDFTLSGVLLAVAGVALVVAVIEHMKHNEHEPFVPPPPVRRADLENRGRALRLGLAPLSVVCTVLMLFEIGSLGKVVEKRWDTYNMGEDNAKQLAGQSCGLSDYVYVEQQPLDGVLTPEGKQPSTPAPGWDPPQTEKNQESSTSWLRPAQQGFVTDGGLPPEATQDPARQQWKPPYQMGGPSAPTWGSYESSGYGTGQMRTPWYPIPQRAKDGDVPIVVAIAGQTDGPNSLTAEFGKDTPEGFKVSERRTFSSPGGPIWRDARITVDGAAKDAEQVRIVARDRGLGTDSWLAFSAPRVPQLTRMTDVIGSSPTFLEWTAAFQHPCLQPSGIGDGVAQMPRYRITAGAEFRPIGQGWSSPDAGGPFGWMDVATSMRELPTYLKGDVSKDWGTLYEVDPYVADALPAAAAMHQHEETHSGLYSPGPFAPPIHLPGTVPNSDNRADLPTNKKDQQ
jgi:arabinosyltransferase C